MKPRPAGAQPLQPRVLAAIVVLVAGTGSAALIGWSTPPSVPSTNFAAIVIIPSDQAPSEVLFPFAVAATSSYELHAVNRTTGLVIEELLDMYPVSSTTTAEVDLVTREDRPWVRVVTNGTFILGIRWERRSMSDPLPFAPGDQEPAQMSVLSSRPDVRIVVMAFQDSVGFGIERIRYAITSLSGAGPSGSYQSGHPVALLAGFPEALSPGPNQILDLRWGEFSIEYD